MNMMSSHTIIIYVLTLLIPLKSEFARFGGAIQVFACDITDNYTKGNPDPRSTSQGLQTILSDTPSLIAQMLTVT